MDALREDVEEDERHGQNGEGQKHKISAGDAARSAGSEWPGPEQSGIEDCSFELSSIACSVQHKVSRHILRHFQAPLVLLAEGPEQEGVHGTLRE